MISFIPRVLLTHPVNTQLCRLQSLHAGAVKHALMVKHKVEQLFKLIVGKLSRDTSVLSDANCFCLQFGRVLLYEAIIQQHNNFPLAGDLNSDFPPEKLCE